jgi:hypothetical protein
MPKVAICFWGICRTTNHTIDSITEHVFNPLKTANIEYDVLVHTFALNKPYSNPRNSEHNISLDNTLYKLLNPTHVEVEDQQEADNLINLPTYRTMGDPWIPAGSVNFCTFDNHLRALYSLNKVTQVALKGGYEKIIFVRPDVKFMHHFDTNWLKIKEGQIIMTDFHLLPINDRFAVTTPSSAKVFGTRFQQAKPYSLSRPLHSEEYLKYCLDLANIEILMVKFRFRRIRAPNLEGDFDITV